MVKTSEKLDTDIEEFQNAQTSALARVALARVPAPDDISRDRFIIKPVTDADKEILERHGVVFADKNIKANKIQ